MMNTYGICGKYKAKRKDLIPVPIGYLAKDDMSQIKNEDLEVIKILEEISGRKSILLTNPHDAVVVGKLNYRIDGLGNVVYLYLIGSGLEDIAHIAQLRLLVELYLNQNDISNLHPIAQLNNLVHLNMAGNHLVDIQALAGLHKLKSLKLKGNQIKDIGPISGLNQLESLELARNQISELAPLQGLVALKRLHLRCNNISDISVVSALSDLEILSLGNNQLSDISPVARLRKLKSLSVGRNKIVRFPSLTALENLESLHASGNNISDASPFAELKKIQRLELNRNNIEDVTPLCKLKNLISLDLRGNQIRRLPVSILDLNLDICYAKTSKTEKGAFFSKNPLENPPIEVVKQGGGALRNYFDSIVTEKKKGAKEFRLYEAKLLIVGRGNVGKTWLSHRLVCGRLPATDGTTRGIDIHSWRFDYGNVKGFRANLWDFGGQQILHSTHQFFLTKRSLYLLVWEARTDDDVASFDYWLNIIKLLSDSSPVLVVMNKSDERVKSLDQRTYEQEFNVIGFYKVSAKDNVGIDELRNRIQKEMVNLPHIGTALPRVWMTVREKLESLEKPYISYAEYRDICSEHGLGGTQAEYLGGYYHNLGVILHFHDNPILRETVFLKPEWITEAVYQLLENFEVGEENGRFKYAQLARILEPARYPIDIHFKLLELMKKFELCFELEGKGEYIVPELLKGDRPKFEWDYCKNLQFEYNYKFMPSGVIARLIARTHELHKDELYWKNGVVLVWDGHTQALVVCEPINRKIRVRIRGKDCKGLLGIIRHHVAIIHDTLNRPEVEQMFPCICEQCQQSEEPYLHKYQELLAVQEKGKDARCNKSAEDIPIKNLFGEYGVEKEDMLDEDCEEDEKTDMVTLGPHPNASEKKSKSGLIWKVLLGVFSVLGAAWTCIQIWESKTCQQFINKLLSTENNADKITTDSPVKLTTLNKTK